MLGAWGMHLDFAPDIAGGGLFPYLEGMAGQAFGMALGSGGADTVIRAHGCGYSCGAWGRGLETGVSVARILHDSGARHGNRTCRRPADHGDKGGDRGRLLPRALMRLTGPTKPAFDQAMAQFSHAPGTMMIHLAMDSLPDWAAGADLQKFAYVHLAPSLDQMARTYQQAQAGLLPDEPVLVVGQPSGQDPEPRARGQACAVGAGADGAGHDPGRCCRARSLPPIGRRRPSPLPNARWIFWNAMPRVRAQRSLAAAIVSPMDLEAENPNLVGGDQLCGSHHLGQNFLFRPARGHADGSTGAAVLASDRGRCLAGCGNRGGAGMAAGLQAGR